MVNDVAPLKSEPITMDHTRQRRETCPNHGSSPCDASRISRRHMLRQSAAWAALAAFDPIGRLSASPVAASKTAPSLPVAIGRSESYEAKQLRARLDTALDQIGGIGDLVRGKTVTIKLNLTGGPTRPLGGLPPHRTYHVHPHFVAATCAALHDAGAKRIVLVESGYSTEQIESVMRKGSWDIEAINSAGGGKVTWEDTRHAGASSKYSRLSVPWGGYIYPAYDLNERYEKTDVLISLAKLKDHANAGVTMTVKNMFGIAPTSIYGDHYDNNQNPTVDERSISARGDTFHRGRRMPPSGVPQEVDPTSRRHWSFRVPRVTADLYAVRPPDLNLIDGIETNRGGEGPWIRGASPITPHLLLAGRNGVCTDAIGAAVMGYDPTAGHREFPFMGDNHLALLAEKGMGTHVVDEIEVRGLSVKEALHPFNPNKATVGRPIFE